MSTFSGFLSVPDNSKAIHKKYGLQKSLRMLYLTCFHLLVYTGRDLIWSNSSILRIFPCLQRGHSQMSNSVSNTNLSWVVSMVLVLTIILGFPLLFFKALTRQLYIQYRLILTNLWGRLCIQNLLRNFQKVFDPDSLFRALTLQTITDTVTVVTDPLLCKLTGVSVAIYFSTPQTYIRKEGQYDPFYTCFVGCVWSCVQSRNRRSSDWWPPVRVVWLSRSGSILFGALAMRVP